MVEIISPKIIKNVNDKIPTRLNVAIMMFMGCLISYMLRVNLSINILAMVKPNQMTSTTTPSPTTVATTTTTTTSHSAIIFANETSTVISEIAALTAATTQTPLLDYGPRYDWSATQQSYLLGAYFWGYFVTSLPGGVMAEKLGGRSVVGWSLGLSALFTAILPPAAEIGFYPFYIVRFILGLLGGVLYPSFHNLVSKWAPPDEKGKFISALMGGAFGTVITWPMCGLITETMGWDYAFYIPALITAVITGLWFFLVADTPNDHPRISDEEKDYINKSLINVGKSKKSWPPIADVLTSLPFYSLLLLHYGSLWGMYFLLTAAPKYMNEILKFNLAKAGLLSALPYLGRLLFAFLFGAIGDTIIRKNWMGVTAIRKTFCLFSHVIPGLFLILLTFVGTNPYVCVAIITMSLGFNGSSTITNLQNSQDLAPNFAGTLYGFINFAGTSTGFITPLVVAYFTKEHNGVDEWSNIFIVGAIVYIVPAIIFAIFGTAKTQKWNEKKEVEGVDNNAYETNAGNKC